ncbi:DUF3073 domain-containing protein [Nonomuraea sp. B10E15]|jgi:hypothetical protein|uniref:DUF3073 domain-containing protein n=2 Tax=Nonomuraea TaxID=83681 RepID=A0A4R4W709_9ACTN|nr:MULTISPECIES: DUF3073 domain-containing protein [Nonomuraea]TDD00923.1 DUF3073 domain-containing protein [Nonomuraea deserti]TDD14449.1 DUF3073 domain-containing protein [Nonomuraea diastatica]
MGRGRAKAKQTKVARQLKYTNHHIDYDRLREELGADPRREDSPTPSEQESERGR